MYTIRMALGCGDVPGVVAANAIEDVASAAVLKFFEVVEFDRVEVEPRSHRGEPSWVGRIDCHSPDGLVLVCPNRLREAESQLAEALRELWLERYGSKCAPMVWMTYALPTDEWDDVLREIA